jgi:DNA helicase HerA-like ATPase
MIFKKNNIKDENTMRKLLLSQKEIMDTVPAYDEHILFALERRYFDFLQLDRMELTKNRAKSSFNYFSDLRMLHLTEVNHAGKADLGLHLMNFQNVLASMKDDSHNVVAVINSAGERISLNYGLSKSMGHEGICNTDDYVRMLGQAIAGNFLGAKATALSAGTTKQEIIEPILTNQNVSAFPGIPSLRDKSGPYVQGLNRFIESMRGEQYCLVVIAEPIPVPDVDGMIRNLFDLSSSVHSNVKATIQKMKGSSDTVNVGMFGMKGLSEGQSATDSTSDSETKLGGGALATQGAGAAGMAIGALIGSVVPVVGTAVGAAIGGVIGTIGGLGASLVGGLPLSNTHSFVRSVTNTIGSTLGGGGFGGYARSWNRSKAATQEVLNKSAEYCEQLCNTYITRLQRGKNLGFWNVGLYLLTQNKYTQLRGHGLLRACLAGDETHWEPIRSLKLDDNVCNEYLANFNNPKYNLLMYGEEKKEFEQAAKAGAQLREYAANVGKNIKKLFEEWGGPDLSKLSTATLEQIRRFPGEVPQEVINKAWAEIEQANLGHPLGPIMGGVSTPMNTEELSIILNVPCEEVLGVSIREAAPFGVNYQMVAEDNAVQLGRLVHKRVPNPKMPFAINRSTLQKHTFICGVTGSGKTNTCFALLQNLELPFLVIEPAKSEYRHLLCSMPDMQIYTLGNETISPFRLNPFEFPENGHLLSHIDNLKAVFNAAFPMYASMPYILEEAIIEVYTDKGWDLATSENIYLQAGEEEAFYDYLPTLQELYNKIENVVSSKQYALEQTMNIGAALKARLASLLTGSKGLMLNTKRSTPLKRLLDSKVLLELKHIGDDDEKCFLMGLLLSQIYEFRDVEHAGGSPLRHIILIEEAHRLLKRVPEYVSAEVGNSRGKAVETFSNVISEIRDYGEGLIIVDQIPTKLTPDVIKNTNVKIVHRTLAEDDREMVGGTIGLTSVQSNELPLLPVGQAVVHNEGADKAFLIQIPLDKNKKNRISDQQIKEVMQHVHSQTPEVFRLYPGLEKKAELPAIFRNTSFRPFAEQAYKIVIGVVLHLLDGVTDFVEIKAEAHQRIANSLRVQDPLSVDCHVIWQINYFFDRLGEVFPRTVDKRLVAQKAFINLWFDEPLDVAGKKAFVDAMNTLPQSGVALKYMLQAIASKMLGFQTFLTNLPQEPDTKTLAVLHEGLCDALEPYGAGFSFQASTYRLFLEALLYGSPQKVSICSQYKLRRET